MLNRSRCWFTSTAAIAVLAFAMPAGAQRDPGAATQTRPQDNPAAARPADPAAGRATPAQDGAAAGVRVTAAPGRGPDARAAALRALAQGETAHRARAAKLARLRQLFAAKGDSASLAQIAALERTENARFEELNARTRAALGDDDFRKTEERLNQGRRRAAAAHEANAERKTPADAPQERIQGQREQGGERAPAAAPERAGNEAPKAAERPKQPERPSTPPAGERPKTDGERKPADGRGGSEAGKGGERPKPAAGERKPESKPQDKPAGGGRGGNPRGL